MPSSEAAKRAWETRRAKALAAGKPIPDRKNELPKRELARQLKERLKAPQPATATALPSPAPAAESPPPANLGAPTGTKYKAKPAAPEPRMVGKYQIDTTDYVRRHRHEPTDRQTQKWHFIVVGRHDRYGSCAKITDSTRDPIPFAAMLEAATKVGQSGYISAGIIRVLP